MLSRLMGPRAASRVARHAVALQAPVRAALHASPRAESAGDKDGAAAPALQRDVMAEDVGPGVFEKYGLNSWKRGVPVGILALSGMDMMGMIPVDPHTYIAVLFGFYVTIVYDQAGGALSGFFKDTANKVVADRNEAEDGLVDALTLLRAEYARVPGVVSALEALQAETLEAVEKRRVVAQRRRRLQLRANVAAALSQQVQRESSRASSLQAAVMATTLEAVQRYLDSDNADIRGRLRRNGLALACLSLSTPDAVGPVPLSEAELADPSNLVDPVDLAYLSALANHATTVEALATDEDTAELVMEELPVVRKLLAELKAEVGSRLPDHMSIDDVQLLPALAPADMDAADAAASADDDTLTHMRG